MGQIVTVPFTGLAVDPNPLVRRGAMSRADEVVCDRLGVGRSRPALSTQYLPSGVNAFRPRSMYVWNGVPIMSSYNGAATPPWKVESLTADLATSGVNPPDFDTVPVQFVEGRKNLYLTTAVGVKKLTSTAATPALAGVWLVDTMLFGFGAAGGQVGTPPFRAAYRYCFTSKDANGYVRRTAPTNRIDLEITPGVGARYGISGRVNLHDAIAAGDVLEMYRTKTTTPATVAPSEEYFLAFAYVVKAADVTQGYIQIPADNTPDENLGASLYTNPSEGGIEDANEVPPVAHCVAAFESCTWYGNTKHRHRVANSIVDVGGGPGAPVNATGLQVRTYNGTYLLAATAITGVADVTGLVTGMAVWDATGFASVGGTNFSPDTLITSITGAGPYTVNISKPTLTASGGAVAINYSDTVSLTRDATTVTWYAWDGLLSLGVGATNYREFQVSSAADYEDRVNLTMFALGYAINLYMVINEAVNTVGKIRSFCSLAEVYGGGPAGEFVWESTDLGGSAFTLTSTRPDAFRTPLTATGQVSDNTTRKNRVYYSKVLEPEAVPIGNYVSVGSENYPILAMAATNAALYVFKGDGVFRISGQAPDNWRIDLVSPTVRILRGGAVAVVDDAVIAWTDQGVVSVRGMEISSLSLNKLNTVFHGYHPTFAATPSAAGFVTFWPKKNLVMVGVPSASDPTYAEYVYVLSIETGEWSRWLRNTYTCAYDPNTKEIFAALVTDDWDIRKSNSLASGSDATRTPLTWVYDSSVPRLTLTSAERAWYLPKVNDWIKFTIGAADYWRRVTKVSTSGGGNRLLDLDSVLPAGSITAVVCYETNQVYLQWNSHGLTGVSSLFRELLPSLVVYQAGPRAALRVIAGAASDIAASIDSAANETLTKSLVQSFPLRFGLSRSVARSTHLYPYLEMGEPVCEFGCLGMNVEYEPTSEKMKR